MLLSLAYEPANAYRRRGRRGVPDPSIRGGASVLASHPPAFSLRSAATGSLLARLQPVPTTCNLVPCISQHDCSQPTPSKSQLWDLLGPNRTKSAEKKGRLLRRGSSH